MKIFIIILITLSSYSCVNHSQEEMIRLREKGQVIYYMHLANKSLPVYVIDNNTYIPFIENDGTITYQQE